MGWSVTHWSLRSLAQAVVEQAVVETIHHTTIGDFLRAADPHLRWGRCIQPHRSRTWKTTIWDEEAVARTLRILWYYERIASLWRRGEVVVAIDEKPNLQVLERATEANMLPEPGQEVIVWQLAAFFLKSRRLASPSVLVPVPAPID